MTSQALENDALIVRTMRVRVGSFDLLRLAAALMVLWSHQFALLGVPETFVYGASPSAVGVYIFFAISGYLNAQSLLKGQSSWRFLVRRACRIYPALVGLAVFCVLVGASFTAAGSEFWERVPDFLFRNSTILFGIRYTLPGVFETNPFPSAMNGSLWTLPSEIKLYIYLAIIAVAVRYRPRFLLVALLAAFLGFLVWFHVTSTTVETAYFQKFAIVFISGAALAIIERHRGLRIAIIVLFGLAILAAISTSAVALLPAFALATILVGKIEPPVWLHPQLDISYGIYLFAFPVQQVIASYGLLFWPSLALSLTITTGLAISSAILIEQPALKWRASKIALARS
ncbi:acyltransferase [Bradyrhizobium liaoningense]|uniref:acyltransferase family protein n=1 Tax=Bradyrhizobium liaoningense TaxID=43992 RepID=UPI001BA52EA9|nr:acyltransferase [Bradyrhizobium liaoningense]MBR0821874.1 acyltransferase [Bradyrhizobium liaoningense]